MLAAAGGVTWAEVLAELERREGRSGIAEKAAVGSGSGDGGEPSRDAAGRCSRRSVDNIHVPWITDAPDPASATLEFTGRRFRSRFRVARSGHLPRVTSSL